MFVTSMVWRSILPLAVLPCLSVLCFAFSIHKASHQAIPTKSVVDYALRLKNLFRQDVHEFADVPHFAALCCGFPDEPLNPSQQCQKSCLSAAESEQQVLKWLQDFPESNFIWMWNPTDHQAKEHHPEAMLSRLALEAQRSSKWKRLAGNLLFYSHKCPCQSCGDKILELKQNLSPTLSLTLCVGLPVRSHIFESVSGTSDRLVYQQLRRAGVQAQQLQKLGDWIGFSSWYCCGY